MIPSTVLQSLQFTGHAYAVALSIFRHTVHEDTGFLSTITDLIPFIFSLSFLFLPRINDTAYSRDVRIIIICVYAVPILH